MKQTKRFMKRKDIISLEQIHRWVNPSNPVKINELYLISGDKRLTQRLENFNNYVTKLLFNRYDEGKGYTIDLTTFNVEYITKEEIITNLKELVRLGYLGVVSLDDRYDRTHREF